MSGSKVTNSAVVLQSCCEQNQIILASPVDDSDVQKKGTVGLSAIMNLASKDEGLLRHINGTPSSNRVKYLTTVTCYYLGIKYEILFDPNTKISELITLLDNQKENSGSRFVNIVCRLAYLKLNNKTISKQEFAGEMTSIGVTDWEQDLWINGIVGPRQIGKVGPVGIDDMKAPGITGRISPLVSAPGVGKNSHCYRFSDPQVQYFLAAIFLYQQPLVEASDYFTTKLLSLNKSCWCVLEFYCGLVKLDGSDDAKIALPHVLKCLLKSVDGTKLIHNNSIVNLVLGCLFEAQNVNLCQTIHREHLTIATFRMRVEVVEQNMEIFSYYVANSSNSTWTLYCHNNDLLDKFKLMTRNTYKKMVLTCKNANFVTPGDVILSCKPVDDVNNIVFTQSLSSSQVPDSAYPHPASESSPLSSSGTVIHDPAGIYGYMSIAEYESRHQVLHEKNFDMLLDILKNRFQELCLTYVEGQYRKRDHLWFSVSRDLRHNLYQSVQISPLVPLHWVKVKQPNGSPELEEQIRQEIELSNQQAVNEIAELVMLNSHQPSLIEFNYPHFEQPVTIALDSHPESNDQGVIGCDCFLERHTAAEPVLARGVRQFDIKIDCCVPRELPLPRKQGEPINKEEPIAESGPPRQEPRPPHVFGAAVPTLSSHFTPTWSDAGLVVPVDQIKKLALKGFDTAGFCFYSTRDLGDYRLEMVYPLPDTLAGARVLREGGNGLILEVSIKCKSYAVEKTAFRWREILVQPNDYILRVAAMLMGPPMPEYRRRFIYQFNPKMKEFYCGLVELDGSDDAKIALPHILKCLLKSVDGTKLIHNNSIVNLVLGCLFEAQNINLCQTIHREHLTIGTFCMRVEVVERNMEIFSYYVANSSNSTWTLYCHNNDLLDKFKLMTRNMYKKMVLTRKNANFVTPGDVILSCKPVDVVNNIMVSQSLSSSQVTDSAYPHPASESSPESPLSSSGTVLHDPAGIYGYISIAEYESRHQVLHEQNFDMLLDILKNRFQELCLTSVEEQYRKRDHLWFLVSRDLRHNLYQSVQISPLVPLHWVKVKQPNGSPELVEQIRQELELSNQQAVNEIAELVMLNSHQPSLIEFNCPHFEQPVTIALDSHPESNDQGVIGCDCFLKRYNAAESVLARGVRQFDIKADCCVPRELPLPRKQGEPINKEEPLVESSPPRQHITLEVAGLKEEDLPSDTAATGDPCSTLSIADLFKVQVSLKRVVHWQSLGLALGLFYPTLEIIEKEQRGDVERCKIKMLAAWLQQQDSVSENGVVPSWSVLRTALRSIGENELASRCTE